MSGSLRLALTGDSMLQPPLHSRSDEVVRPLVDLIRGAEIHLIDLGLGEARHRRGRPQLARADETVGILSRLQRPSRTFDTELLVTGSKAILRLPAQAPVP